MILAAMTVIIAAVCVAIAAAVHIGRWYERRLQDLQRQEDAIRQRRTFSDGTQQVIDELDRQKDGS